MARDRSVLVRLRASVSEFTGPLKQAKQAVDDVTSGTKDAQRGLAQHARENREAWTTTGAALTTYGAAVTGLGAAVLGVGISYNTLRQRSVAALTTLTGSAEAANAQMDKLDEFASTSPFARDVFIRAQQQLIGFGMAAEDVVPTLDAIQNAVAATGGTNEDIAELTRIIAQVGAAGKITAEDLNQFGQRGVDAATLIGSQMGKTGQQIREEITSGTLDADAAIAALVTGMDERFGGAAENVKGTMDGAVDRVKAAFRDISASFASVLVDPEGGGLLVDGLNSVADALRAFEDLPTPIRNTGIALGIMTGPLALAAGGFLLLAPRLVETWDALGKMGRLGTGTQDLLRGIGKHAKTAAIGLGALGLLGALSAAGHAMNDFELSTEEAENRLRNFQDTVTGGDLFSGDLDGGFMANLRELSDDSWWRPLHGNLADFGDGLGALFGQDTRSDFYKFRDDMASFDRVLSGMATESLPDAVENFGRLADMTDGSNDSLLTLLSVLPGYREHLVGVANDMGIAATDTNILALATGELKPVLDEVGAAAEGAAEGVEDLNGQFVKIDPSILQGKADEIEAANRDILQSFINLGDGINDEELSLDGWLANLEAEITAQAAFAENIAFLRGKGVNEAFVQGLLEQGPAGATRAQQLVDSITGGDTEVIPRANAIGEAMGGATLDGAQGVLDASDPLIIKAEAQAEAQQIAEEKARLESIFYADGPVEVPVDADTAPAHSTIDSTLAWALEQNGIVTFDADGSLATLRIEEWNETARNTTGMPILDADPARARQQIADYFAAAADTTGVAILDANGNPADDATDAWAWRAGRTEATATLDAWAGPAFSALYSFLNAVPNSVSVSIRAVPIVGSLFRGMFASGGYTGPGAVHEPAGEVHRGEFVHTQAHTHRPGMLQFHSDLWQTNDLDGAYRRHKLRGYADGGPVGGSSIMRTPAPQVNVAAPSLDSGAIAQAVGQAVESAMSGYQPMVKLGDRDLYGQMVRVNGKYAGRTL